MDEWFLWVGLNMIGWIRWLGWGWCWLMWLEWLPQNKTPLGNQPTHSWFANPRKLFVAAFNFPFLSVIVLHHRSYYMDLPLRNSFRTEPETQNRWFLIMMRTRLFPRRTAEALWYFSRLDERDEFSPRGSMSKSQAEPGLMTKNRNQHQVQRLTRYPQPTWKPKITRFNRQTNYKWRIFHATRLIRQRDCPSYFAGLLPTDSCSISCLSNIIQQWHNQDYCTSRTPRFTIFCRPNKSHLVDQDSWLV